MKRPANLILMTELEDILCMRNRLEQNIVDMRDIARYHTLPLTFDGKCLWDVIFDWSPTDSHVLTMECEKLLLEFLGNCDELELYAGQTLNENNIANLRWTHGYYKRMKSIWLVNGSDPPSLATSCA